MGLAWIHWMNVLLSAIAFVLCLVFQAETLYDRPQTSVAPEYGVENKQTVDTKESVVVAGTVSPASYPPYSHLRSLRLISYQPGVVEKFLAPYKTLRLPGVWLVSSWYAGLVGLIVSEDLFQEPSKDALLTDLIAGNFVNNWSSARGCSTVPLGQECWTDQRGRSHWRCSRLRKCF